MRIDSKKFWAVRDPGPSSELGDVLMEFDLASFARYCVGSHFAGTSVAAERTAFYDDPAEARRDAGERLAARRAADAAG